MSKNIPVQYRQHVQQMLRSSFEFTEVEHYKDISGDLHIMVSADQGYRIISSTKQPSLYQEIVGYLLEVI